MEKISRNFIWMAAANLVGSFFSIWIFIYLARTLMPEAFGRLSYAITFVFYLTNFIDLGLSTYGIREVAKNHERISRYVSEIVSFKLIVAAILYILFAAATYLSNQPDPMKLLMAESALLLFTSALVTDWAFQGVEKMHMVFISFFVTFFLQFILVGVLVKGPQDIFRVPEAYIIAAIPIIAAFLIKLKFRFRINMVDIFRIRLYLGSSLVIWAISIFAQVYNNVDIIILGLFRDAAEVGYFSIARRVVGGITFLMIFLTNALLPRLSCALKDKDVDEFKQATRKFLKVALILIAAFFVPMVVFSKAIISMTVGEAYLPARLPLDFMLAGLVLVFFNLPFSTGLIAACHEKEVLKQVIACAALSVALNFTLIPKYGMIGASVSFFMVEAVALVWILLVYRRKIHGIV